MATIISFEDIEAWQLARELSREIYELTQKESFSKDYSLKDQINRSSGSVMDNIAEGFDRGGNKEFIHFLSISKGSCAEVRSQLYSAMDRNHLNSSQINTLKERAIIISKKISGLITYLLSSDKKGAKFKEPSISYNAQAQSHLTLNLEH